MFVVPPALFAFSAWRWLRHLGGLGLILLGLADNSVIPLPGSMDILTIWLTVHHRSFWPYYVSMATLGAVLGGYITYHLAQKGGRAAMERKLGAHRAEKVYARFEKWGFGAIAVPAMLPPPFPIVPFVLAAGAMQYSRNKFLGALALGRALRYGILAALGLIYGRQFLRFFSKYTKPTIYAVVAMSAIAGGASLWAYWRYRQQAKSVGKAVTAT